MPKFTNVAAEVGLDFRHGAFRWGMSGDPVAMMGGGLCWLDYDNDGWLDLFVVNSYALAEAGKWQQGGGLPTTALYRNNAGIFADTSQQTGTNLPLRGNGCVAADLNADGWTDLYITTSRSNVLLWNNGDGTFADGGRVAGVDAYGWQTAATVGDLNGDGLPDLFVAGYIDRNNLIPNATMGFPNTHFGRRDLLFMNGGNDPETGRATFREVGEMVGLETENFEYGLGATLSDFDMDGDLDLFISNDTNPNRLYENVPMADDVEGLGFRLVEVGENAGISDNNSGMGVANGDFNGDGLFDLMITNMGQQLHSVYLNSSNDGQLSFANAASDIGIADIGVGWTGWGISWADIDLDSDLDLVVINGTIPVTKPDEDTQKVQFFSNLSAQGEPGQFEDITDSVDLANMHPIIGRGSAMADYDNDGDLDIAINSIGGELVLLRNDEAGGNWLTVALAEFEAGAIVTALLPDGRVLLCATHAGSSYHASEDPRCHFGLGNAGIVTQLQVRWLDGTVTELKDVPVNEVVVVFKK